MSYSVKQHAFETLLEPSLLGLRVLVVPAQYNTDMLGETLEVAPVAFKVWAGTSPLYVTVTHNVVSVLAPLLGSGSAEVLSDSVRRSDASRGSDGGP